jgi:hypothetical protein
LDILWRAREDSGVYALGEGWWRSAEWGVELDQAVARG